MNQSKDIFARLLANENISIRRGNFRTAYFDVQNRELGIPLWNNLSKDEEDLFIGHEVGHALETPIEGWHDSVVNLPIPRSFVNVVEDIRIERKVQAKYPGLVSSFKRGYSSLMDRNFFGLDNVDDVNDLSLIDRINLKAKLRDLIDVEFSTEEQPFVDQAMQVESFQDVLDACYAIYDFMKEQQENSNDSSMNIPEEFSEDSEEISIGIGNNTQDSDPSDVPDTIPGETPTDKNSSKESKEEAKESADTKDETSDQDLSEEKSSEQGTGNTVSDQEEELKAITDDAFRENEKKLIDSEDSKNPTLFIQPVTLSQAKKVIVPYDVIQKSRTTRLQELTSTWEKENLQKLLAEYPAFLNETSKAVGILIKEFEMRKAAYRYSRAKESKSGTLNMNKIHSYKYNEDIFNRVTMLADAKSHGMVMLIDYSGSMSNILGNIIKQLLNLVMFCKKANIPFQVYGFSSRSYGYSSGEYRDGEINLESFKLLDLINSNMDRATYNEAYYSLYLQSCYPYVRSYIESLGSTPLNESLMCLDPICKELNKNWGVQKMNLVVLTDGEPSSMAIESSRYSWSMKFQFMVNGKIKEARDYEVYPELIQGFTDRGYNTIGIFLDNKRNISTVIRRDYGFYGPDMEEAVKKVRKDGIYFKKNFKGYQSFMYIDNGKTGIESEEMNIDSSASKSKIISEFKKFSSSKKNNRFLAVKFAEAIA